MKTLQEFMDECEVKFKATSVPRRPDGLMSENGQHHYKCKIERTEVWSVGNGQCRHADRSMTFYFSMAPR